jgi:hypothetical protein
MERRLMEVMTTRKRILYLLLGIFSPVIILGYALFCMWLIGNVALFLTR